MCKSTTLLRLNQMFGLSENTNWLIILKTDLLDGTKANSSLIRNVKVESYDVRTMRDFQFELDGYGRRLFFGELRFNISDEEVARWVEDYSREDIIEQDKDNPSLIRHVGYGEYKDTPCFHGKTSKLKLFFRSKFIRSLLGETDYNDSGSKISWYRVYPKGSPFADWSKK